MTLAVRDEVLDRFRAVCCVQIMPKDFDERALLDEGGRVDALGLLDGEGAVDDLVPGGGDVLCVTRDVVCGEEGDNHLEEFVVLDDFMDGRARRRAVWWRHGRFLLGDALGSALVSHNEVGESRR